MDFNSFSRRHVLGTGIGLGMAGAGSLAFGASPGSSAYIVGSANVAPASLHRRTLLMKNLLGEGLQVSALKGTFYSVEGGYVQPLHGAVMATYAKHSRLPDGTIETRAIEVEWYTDLDGVIFDEWKNPITGKTCKQPSRKYYRHSIVVAPDLSIKSLTLGARYIEKVLGWREDGDDLFMFNQLSTLPRPAGNNNENFLPAADTKPIATELATYHARVSEIDVPGIKKVRHESYHSCEGPYRPWQQMGDAPGYLLLLCWGGSINGPSQLPLEWIIKTTKEFPELVKDPEAILDAQ